MKGLIKGMACLGFLNIRGCWNFVVDVYTYKGEVLNVDTHPMWKKP